MNSNVKKEMPSGRKAPAQKKGLCCRRAEGEAGQKIPIFENDQEQNGLGDSDEAEQGTLLVKAAEDGFPDENQQAGGAEGAADLMSAKRKRKSSRQK